MTLEEFLETSYTAYHATENSVGMLRENGFKELILGDKWTLTDGGKYFTVKNGSSFAAFVIGKNKVFNIAESHTDSPSFKLKGGKAVVSEGLKRLNTEKYGGGILYSFFDRPLKIAGRVVCENADGVTARNTVSNFNVVIPSLAVHHNPAVNEGFSVNAQNDTLPLWGSGETTPYDVLGGKDKILDADLYVVPDAAPFYCGADEEYICSPRIDNLTSVYACVQGICNASPQDIAVTVCFDNEETGSATRQGACSEFLPSVLEQIAEALKFTKTETLYAKENGFVLSIDNAHAVHPAHPEKSDVADRVYLNGGIVIKHNVNYATDGLASAAVKRLLDKADIKHQDYYNRSDVRCGSTIGLVTAAQLSMKVCDIGIAQLAMHSACETAGAKDVPLMVRCVETFLSANLSGAGYSVAIKIN